MNMRFDGLDSTIRSHVVSLQICFLEDPNSGSLEEDDFSFRGSLWYRIEEADQPRTFSNIFMDAGQTGMSSSRMTWTGWVIHQTGSDSCKLLNFVHQGAFISLAMVFI